jgi:hypothetical protein
MTGVAASETSTGKRGMSLCGRKYVFRVPSATRVQVIRSGMCLPKTGRLVAANINNHLTTGVDPTQTYVIDAISAIYTYISQYIRSA